MADRLDPEERKELDQNDLARFFENFGEFWNKNGTWLVATIAIIAIVYAGYNIITRRAMEKQEVAWFDLYGSASHESFRLTADEHDDVPAVAALANLRGADLLMAKVNDPNRDEDGKVGDTGLTPEEALDTAEAMYQQAMEVAEHLVYTLNALEGLGVVAESRFDLEQARTHYQAIIEQAGEDYPAFTARAEKRIEWLAKLGQPIEFAPEAPPEASETSEAPESEAGAEPEAGSDEQAAPEGEAAAMTEGDAKAQPDADSEVSDATDGEAGTATDKSESETSTAPAAGE
jgi:hypothetical protein